MAASLTWKALFGLFLSFLVFFGPTAVDAGQKDWETSRPMVNGSLVKKALFINENDPTIVFTWPDHAIPYVIDGSERMDRDRVREFLQAGMKVWYAAGLLENYGLVEVDQTWCDTNPHYRSACLLVKEDNGGLRATVGRLMMGYDWGGTLYLDVDPRSIEQAAADVAHEIGHVFGLYHEHQNPYFWGLSPDDSHNVFDFRCQNLRGFEQFSQGLTQEQIYGPKGICRDWEAAFNRGFRAAEFLPRPQNFFASRYLVTNSELSMAIQRDRYVDWDSIMLYDSFAFTADGISPTLILHRGRGEGNDKLITRTTMPSVQDVNALTLMYGIRYGGLSIRLHTDPKSHEFGHFQSYSQCDY